LRFHAAALGAAVRAWLRWCAACAARLWGRPACQRVALGLRGGVGAYLGMNYFLISKGNEFAVIDRNENFIIPFSGVNALTFSIIISQVLKAESH
jgi:hypothetical protein